MVTGLTDSKALLRAVPANPRSDITRHVRRRLDAMGGLTDGLRNRNITRFVARVWEVIHHLKV